MCFESFNNKVAAGFRLNSLRICRFHSINILRLTQHRSFRLFRNRGLLNSISSTINPIYSHTQQCDPPKNILKTPTATAHAQKIISIDVQLAFNKFTEHSLHLRFELLYPHLILLAVYKCARSIDIT